LGYQFFKRLIDGTGSQGKTSKVNVQRAVPYTQVKYTGKFYLIVID